MKTVYVGLGLLFLGLGVIGIMLPLLPTVPFLLLASICFAKGSRRFYAWFTSTAIYRNHLQDLEENWSMPLKSKIGILTISTLMMSLPFFIVDNRLVHLFLLILLAVKYYVFLVKIKTTK
ncbi:YbaN family protein [Sporomusa termitida]|uniref:Inner membrane protein YbaN n=1 Tax=Sporomusa termitida TaxID=2377 RepID=A0A517DZA5_9FIRM|nr:YbaN family protein [Sporomusa termitida]QDR82700.1 Inner membrane protein YbaN [Sporomusa termitida]